MRGTFSWYPNITLTLVSLKATTLYQSALPRYPHVSSLFEPVLDYYGVILVKKYMKLNDTSAKISITYHAQ